MSTAEAITVIVAFVAAMVRSLLDYSSRRDPEGHRRLEVALAEAREEIEALRARLAGPPPDATGPEPPDDDAER